MKDQGRNFLIGLASIGALLGLAAIMLLFGELDRLLVSQYVVTLETDHAAGLRPGSSVEFSGVPIGVVDEVSLGTEPRFPVLVTVLIDGNIELPKDAIPYAATSLLGGASSLEIAAPATATGEPSLPRDGTATIRSPLRFRIIEQIGSELDRRMVPLMDALRSFGELSGVYSEFGRNLNDLVALPPEGATDAETRNLRTLISRLYEVLDTTEEAVVLARDWLGDEQMRADAHSAIAMASSLIDEASGALARFTRLAGTLEDDSKMLIERLLPVADEMSQTLEEVRRLSALAREGPGTIGLLLNSPDLYRSLDDAAARLERTLAEVQLFVEKVKAEGLPVHF